MRRAGSTSTKKPGGASIRASNTLVRSATLVTVRVTVVVPTTPAKPIEGWFRSEASIAGTRHATAVDTPPAPSPQRKPTSSASAVSYTNPGLKGVPRRVIAPPGWMSPLPADRASAGVRSPSVHTSRRVVVMSADLTADADHVGWAWRNSA